MKIETESRTIAKLLKDNVIEIPRFQRPYSWEDEHVSQFLDDLKRNLKKKYFIGSMVAYLTNSGTSLIDGQQRLTTIIIVLAVIRDMLESLGKSELAQGVQQYIEYTNRDHIKEFSLRSQTSYPFLHEQIQSFPAPPVEVAVKAEEIAIKDAKALAQSFINEQLEGATLEGQVDILKLYRDALLDLVLVYVQLDGEQEAYQVFTILNTRGKDLTSSDVIKSLIFQNLKPKNKGLDKAKDKWDKMRARLEDAGGPEALEKFFLHHVLSTRTYTTRAKLYDIYSEEVKSTASAENLLNELVGDSELYEMILDPDSIKKTSNYVELQPMLWALARFKVAQPAPYILSLLRAYRDGVLKLSNTKDALTTLENYHFFHTYLTSQRSSGGISKRYSVYAKDVYQCKTTQSAQVKIRELKTKLRATLPPDVIINEEFNIRCRYSKTNTKTKGLCQYVLYKMFLHLNPTKPMLFEQMSIEHILPQSNTDKEVVERMGNLVMVNKTLNGEILKDKPFPQKKKLLTEDGMKYDDVLMSAAKWDINEIEQREVLLITLAKKVWLL